MTSLMNFKAPKAFAAAFTAFILLLASTSNATITISGASGVSRADAPAANLATFNIWGGTANNGGGDCPSAGSSTCNSCSGVDINDLSFAGCNEKAITANTEVIITFTSTVAGYAVATTDSGTTTGGTTTNTNINETTATSGNYLAAGTSASVTVKWSQICGQTTGADTTCATDGTGTFFVGISTSPSLPPTSETFPISVTLISKIKGFYFADDNQCNQTHTSDDNFATTTDSYYCYFETYPGDSKVTVQHVGQHQSPAGLFSALRFYYKEAAVQGTTNGDPTYSGTDFGTIDSNSGSADIQLDPAGSGGFVGNGRVSGLVNNTVYVFKMGHIDKAGNLGLITSDYTSVATGTPTSGAQTYVADSNCDSGKICHMAEPGAVEGILAKELNCFIATAAYGSPFQSKVQTFRDFRNRYLLNNSLGKKFVHFYYAGFGPRAAEVIRHNETLRAMSRTALFPVWLFAKLSLELGFFGALLVSLGFFGLLIMTARVCSQHLRMDA